MFKGLGNIASLLQNARNLGDKLQAVADELKAKRVTGSAGGGLVQVEVNGLCEVLRLKIDPMLMERGEREMLEDLIPAAMNQALQKAKALHAEMAQTAAKDLPFSLPGLEDALARFSGQ